MSLVKKVPVYEQSNLKVEIDVGRNIWAMCVRDLLMIDFDFKDGYTEESSLEIVRKYTEYMYVVKREEYMFKNYRSDRGVHSFLVNKKMDYLNPESVQIMIDMCNGPYYIGFTEVRGFCVRLGPKIDTVKPIDEILQGVMKEFVSRPINGKDFRIGYGVPLEYTTNILRFKLDLTEVILGPYRRSLN